MTRALTCDYSSHLMITIREANRLDAQAISDLMVPVAASHIAADFPPEGRKELLGGMSSEAVGKNLQQGYRYYVAHDGKQLCGVIGMRGYSHVYHLFVTDDLQGQGVGRQLWEQASRASLAEVRLTEFTVYSSSFAEAFYQRMGFRRSGDAKTRKGVTAIPMRLVIDVRRG